MKELFMSDCYDAHYVYDILSETWMYDKFQGPTWSKGRADEIFFLYNTYDLLI